MSQADATIERREHTRFTCDPPLLASFISHEGSVSARVDDLSPAGAKLRVPYSNQRMPFLVQGEFDYTFHTKEGASQCRGRTAWVQRVEGDFVWGIEFTNLDQRPDDPLRMAVDRLDSQAQAM